VVTVSNVSQLMSALQSAHAGDTIKLAAGTYSGVQLNNLNFSSAVTITSADTSHPAVLSGLGMSSSSGINFDHVGMTMVGVSDPYYAFRMYDTQNVSFNAVNVTGSTTIAPGNQASGFYIVGGGGISFTNSTFQDMNSAIVAQTNGLTVTNSTFTQLDKGGIELGGTSNVSISGNTFTNFIGTAGTHQDAIQIFTQGTTAAASNISIVNNTISRGDGTVIQGIFIRDETGVMPYHNVTITGNQVAGEAWDSIVVASDVTGVLNVSNNTVTSWTGNDLEGGTGIQNFTGQINLVGDFSGAQVTETGNVAQGYTTGDSSATPNGNVQIGAIQAVSSLAGEVAGGVTAIAAQVATVEQGAVHGNLLTGATGGSLYLADVGVGSNPQQALSAGTNTINGAYGVLTVNSDGTYTYTETANGLVAGQAYSEHFTTTVANSAGQGTSSTLDISFTGASVGDGGVDTMMGGAGATTLSGFGAGSTLTAGVGKDTFEFDTLSQGAVSSTPTLIKSFKTGDVVDLSHLDPNFHIVSQFDGHAHELMVQQIGGGNWMVYGDTTGAGVANFEIHLTNVQSPLMASNFHL
jgi:VCBS repeat-containing protein